MMISDDSYCKMNVITIALSMYLNTTPETPLENAMVVQLELHQCLYPSLHGASTFNVSDKGLPGNLRILADWCNAYVNTFALTIADKQSTLAYINDTICTMNDELIAKGYFPFTFDTKYDAATHNVWVILREDVPEYMVKKYAEMHGGSLLQTGDIPRYLLESN